MVCFKVILLILLIDVICGTNEFCNGQGHFEFIEQFCSKNMTYHRDFIPNEVVGGKWQAAMVNGTLGSPLFTNGIKTHVTERCYVQNKISIKVFYETLCPGSIHFITNQLRPTAEKLGRYLDIHLVPYGHARTREVYGQPSQYQFECQHGPQECFGNRLHACAVDVLHNDTQAAIFNACLMTYANYKKDPGFDYTIVVNWCNYKLNMPIKGIWDCVNGDRSSALLKTYGEETKDVGLRYIPYILIEDSPDKQDEATRDLTSTICRMLKPTPSSCYS